MKKTLISIITILMLAVTLVLASACTQSGNDTSNNTQPSEACSEHAFRSEKLLDEHYEKHGEEMGFADAEEYEEAADQVIHNKEALHKYEKEDGDDVYYVEDTNEFVVVAPDGYIRTYFQPDSGIKYYNKQ